MRVRREASTIDLTAEAPELLLAQPPLEIRAGVDPGRGVPLHVDEIATVLLRPRPPEVVEPDLVERLGGLVARDVPAELGRLGVRLQDDRDRVPADERCREPLQLRITGENGLLVDADRVDVRAC